MDVEASTAPPRRIEVRKTTLVLLAIYAVGLAISIVGRDVLPPRFDYDAGTIRERMLDLGPFALDDSFGNTARVYQLIGFGWLFPDSFAGPFSYTVDYWVLVVAAGLLRGPWHAPIYFWFAVWNVPLAVFVGTYSKEFIALLVISAMLMLARTVRGLGMAIILALLYAAFFRSYWAIILMLSMAMLAGRQLGIGWAGCLAIAGMLLLGLSWSVHEFMGQWVSDARTISVLDRAGDPDSVTVISNLVENSSPVTDLFNIVAGWLSLILPIYLFILSAFQHVAFGIFQIINTALFIGMVRNFASSRGKSIDPADARSIALAIAWCIGYSLVQGAFEPDFGSFARHEIALAPMFFYLLIEAQATRAASVDPAPDPRKAT